MDRNENTEEIQDCGKDRPLDDVSVGNTDKVRHQESGGAHDGRHDLAACGGSRFDRAGELVLITGLLHHGNGNGTGGHGVADRRTGDHAAESGGNDRHLGGTAGETSGDGVGHINEEIGNAGPFQEGAENDKDDDIFGTDVDRRSQYAFLGIEKVADQIFDPAEKGGVGQSVGQGVDQKEPCHAQNGDTDAAPGDLHQGQYADDTYDDLIPLKAGTLVDDLVGVEGIVQKGARARDHKDNVIDRNIVGPDLVLSVGVDQKAHQNDQGHEGGQTDLLQESSKQSHIDTPDGEGSQNESNGNLRLPGPDTCIGLAVIFSHYGIQVGLTYFRCDILAQSILLLTLWYLR